LIEFGPLLAVPTENPKESTVANPRDEQVNVGRRQALQLFGAGLTGLVLLGATRASAETAELRCKERVALDEAAVSLRRALQYKEKAPTAEKHCAICAQFEEGKYGDCGGCKVLVGAVNPNGVCLSFAPKTAPAPAAPEPAPAAKPATPAKKT
jgi:hypothetical protein